MFATKFREQRKLVGVREWGILKAGMTGPALVLLPGTLGRGDIFWHQIEHLKNRVQILALTYPDSGSIEDWADDIAEIMDSEAIAKATLLGSSLGGYVAQYFAGVHGGRVENLIAANTLNAVNFLANVPPYSNDLDEMSFSQLRQGFFDALKSANEEDPLRVELIELLLAEVSGRINENELRTRLKALKFGPTLPQISLGSEHIFTVESSDDPLIPQMLREGVRASLKPGRAFRFLAGGHFPYVLHPQTYTALIEEVIGLENVGKVWPQMDRGDISQR